MKSILAKKISIGYCIVAVLFSIGGTLILSQYFPNLSFSGQSSPMINTGTVSLNCTYDVKRLNGYDYIRPLMFVDNECESEDLFAVKQRINALIDQFKGSGDLISASVYLKSYSKNGWIGINENEKFSPGSLMKVPVLITFLKMNEKKVEF